MTHEEINALTERIIGAAIRVRKELGLGFLEKVYENAMCVQLREEGIEVVQQQPLVIQYHGQVVGNYCADLVVAGSVIVELKAARAIEPVFMAQAINYLRATNLGVALVLNFGPEKLEFKRVVGPAFKVS
jgi:GxxExxY protein